MGVKENDFHDRTDMAPNICAVYTEEEYRGRGICGEMLQLVVADNKANRIVDNCYNAGLVQMADWTMEGDPGFLYPELRPNAGSLVLNAETPPKKEY